MALLWDEVFSDFTQAPLPALDPGILSFRFGGLSKSLGLPQLKLAWMVMEGPVNALEEALDRLGFIADSYLCASTSVQVALPALLKSAPEIQRAIRERLEMNRGVLEQVFSGAKSVKFWKAPGGWQGLLEILGSGRRDEDWAEDLVREKGVLVHPGMFYDFSEGCFLVLSLLPEPDKFKAGVKRIRDLIDESVQKNG
jgi:aspartate/methionine/tyrosine aminotransferase